MNTHSSLGRRLVAALGAAALGLVGAVGISTAANAADDPQYGNIDQDATGSIIIHKHEHQTTTSETATPDGSTDILSPGVAGVVFTAYPITSLPLDQPGSWDTLSNLSVPATACDTRSLAGQMLGTGVPSGETNSNGVATISTPVAAYLVCETTSPSTVVDKAQPFVVTVPFPDTEANGGGMSDGWLYNVNVYPKNGVTSIKKTVTSQPSTDLGLDSVVSFPVTTTVPKIADNAYFKYYQIKDPMDSRLGSVGVASVTLDGANLTADNDYTVDVSSNTVTVKFTADGLIKLKNAAPAEVVTTFRGTVTSLTAEGRTPGEITNKASVLSDTTVIPTPPEEPPTPEEPATNPPTEPPTSPEVTSNWGDVKISKVDSGNTTATLEGAKFEIYAAADPYATNCTATLTGDALTVSGRSTFTSDENGVVSIAGLFVSDSENAPVNNATRCYVVREIQAPAGYTTPTDAAALTAVTVHTGATTGVDVTIQNTKQKVPGLPLTGANGQLLALIGGGALVLLAGGTALVARKRSHQD